MSYEINYSRTITDSEAKILSNDLLDIEAWVNAAIDGKLNNCTKRLAQQHKDRLIDDGATTVPATNSGLVADAILPEYYTTRAERDAAAASGQA